MPADIHDMPAGIFYLFICLRIWEKLSNFALQSYYNETLATHIGFNRHHTTMYVALSWYACCSYAFGSRADRCLERAV